jgi:hypothetical protein
MKNTTNITQLTLFVALALSTISFAGSAEVRWSNVEKYSDVHEGDEKKADFLKNTLSELERHFIKLESKLPKGYKLHVNVFDLDLAGSVSFQSSRHIRIIGSRQSPRFLFKYQVLNSKNELVTQGTENLRDTNFKDNRSKRYPNQSLRYEKRLLDQWFKDTIKKKINT